MRAGCILVAAAALLCGDVYLDEKHASELVLRGCDPIEKSEKSVSAADRSEMEKLSGLRFPAQQYTIYIGKRNGAVAGYGVVMNEIGKSEPITFMVGVMPDGSAGDVEIMAFRESRGWEVKQPRFTRQFKGKTLDKPIRVNQDIMNYTGATLSSEAVARGVRKALALVRHFYLTR